MRAAHESARTTLERSVAAKPRDPDQRMFLAEAYARLGHKEEAIREARLAAEIVPENKDPFFGADLQESLASVYVMVGEFDQALPIFEHLLTVPLDAFH